MLRKLLERLRGPEVRAFVDQALSWPGLQIAPASIDSLAAVEAASGLYGRAFALARIVGPPGIRTALEPGLLALVGRQLVRAGECVLQIAVTGDGLEITPAASWNITSTSPRERDWTYYTEQSGPSGSQFRRLPSASVIHVRYSVTPGIPWRGRPPLSFAADSAKLLASLDDSLQRELNKLSSDLIGLEVRQNETPPTPAEMQTFQAALGQNALQSLAPHDPRIAESQRGPSRLFGVPVALPRSFAKSRVGPEVSAASVSLRSAAAESCFAAMGIPQELVTSSDGAASREAWRRFRRSIHRAVRTNRLRGIVEKTGLPKSRWIFRACTHPTFKAGRELSRRWSNPGCR